MSLYTGEDTKVYLARLEWDENQQADVHSLDELERLIDELSLQAQGELPFSVELYGNVDTCLSILVGGEVSHLEFFSAKSRPPVVVSSGPWSDDEFVVCTHRGHYSEMPKKYCIPVADAREALRRYFLTGERPDNVAWE
jgi:hypothetical protein